MPIVIGVAAVITLIRRDAWIRLRTFERGLALAEIAIGLIFAFLLGTTLPALPTLLERFVVHR